MLWQSSVIEMPCHIVQQLHTVHRHPLKVHTLDTIQQCEKPLESACWVCTQ